MVVVGDSLRHDIQGGIELGALTVQVQIAEAVHDTAQVHHDNEQVADEVQPDAIIQHLTDLPDDHPAVGGVRRAVNGFGARIERILRPLVSV